MAARKGRIPLMNKRLQEQVDNVLNRLSVPITILDADSDRLPDGMPLSTLRLTEGEARAMLGSLYMAVPSLHIVLTCAEQQPGARDVLQLATMLIAALDHSGENRTESSSDVYCRALRGDLMGSELEALSHEHQLPQEMDRTVMLFHIVQTENECAYDLLRDITPVQDKDVLLNMDRHTVVLIKEMTDVETIDDLHQFAQALQETLMGETAHQMTVGIGKMRRTIDELRDSYNEARRAIEVGRIFKPEESIYIYSRLILERFLMELPQDISAYYHGLLFNRKNQRLFNEEMLYTIEMFFKKDLNLSDTARQLYIHRNTLVYRLLRRCHHLQNPDGIEESQRRQSAPEINDKEDFSHEKETCARAVSCPVLRDAQRLHDAHRSDGKADGECRHRRYQRRHRHNFPRGV